MTNKFRICEPDGVKLMNCGADPEFTEEGTEGTVSTAFPDMIVLVEKANTLEAQTLASKYLIN